MKGCRTFEDSQIIAVARGIRSEQTRNRDGAGIQSYLCGGERSVPLPEAVGKSSSIEAVRPSPLVLLCIFKLQRNVSPRRNKMQQSDMMILAENVAALPRQTKFMATGKKTRPVAIVYYFQPISIKV